MQKKSIIIGILIVVVIMLGYFSFFKNKEINDDKVVAPAGQTQVKDNVTGPDYQPQGATSDGWLKSPKFGLYYQSNLNIIEYYRTKIGEIVYEPQAGTSPEFSATFGPDQDAVITWGGTSDHDKRTCTSDEFGKFNYGVSGQTCLKGYKTWVAHFSARRTVSADDLKIFGDFVLKNQ